MANKRASSNRGTPQKPAERDVMPPGMDVPDNDLFFNRELSWLAFNNRVLQLAEDTSVPLMERVKFCAIYARNLDEFFMIRVARLHEQVRGRVARLVPDGATPGDTLDKLHAHILEQGRRHGECFGRQLRPMLAEKGLRILSMKELDAEQPPWWTSASASRSSPCSPRWPSAWGVTSRTSPTSRSAWRCCSEIR